MVTDPQSSGAVYAGGPGGIFKSVNGGFSWRSLDLIAIPLAVDPQGSVYASDIHYAPTGIPDSTLYASNDGGTSWRVLSQGGETGLALTVDPVTSTTLYRIDTTTVSRTPFTFGALFRSTDSGSTWIETDQALGLTDVYVSAFAADPRNQGTFYLATAGSDFFQPIPAAIYKTTNGGSSWSREGAILGTVSILAVDPLVASTLYTGVSNSLSGPVGTYRSTDGGATFQSVNGLIPRQVIADPNNAGRIYLATFGQGVQTSADGGSTWAPMNAGLTDLAVLGIALDAGGTVLHAATASGVFDYLISSSACVTDPQTLCLDGGRFAVKTSFQSTPEGPSIPATAVPLTGDTGYFWFFDPTNVELVVKVLTGCSVNNSYWVFAGGLTDVGVEVKVTDAVTGTRKTYSNAVGTPFQPIQDSSAFPCP